MKPDARFLIVILCATAACTVKKENPTDTTAIQTSSSTSSVTQTVPPPPVDTSRAPAQAPPTDGASSTNTSTNNPGTSFTVTEYGIGPIRAGMTVAEAATAMGGGFGAPSGGARDCTYAALTKAPRGLAVMLENNRVARVEIRSGTIPTSLGARIGDSEARIKSLYAGRVTSTPHKYTPGGHYLTVTPADNSQNRIVFETDGKKVTEYRSGQLPAVEYVERCG